jgi:hypothetical protein
MGKHHILGNLKGTSSYNYNRRIFLLQNVDLNNSNVRINLRAFLPDGFVMDLITVETIQMRRTVPI